MTGAAIMITWKPEHKLKSVLSAFRSNEFGATKQRSAHNLNFVWSKRSGERGNEGADSTRLRKQWIEVQPKISMVTRLKPKVATPTVD